MSASGSESKVKSKINIYGQKAAGRSACSTRALLAPRRAFLGCWMCTFMHLDKHWFA